MKKIIYFAVIITVIIFLGCEKENQNIFENNRMYSKSTIDSLMNEAIIYNMLSELNNYDFEVNSHGLFSFESIADMDSVIKILYETDFAFEDSLNLYPDQAPLVAFEKQYGFNSLRNDIRKKITILENTDKLTDLNDPDNHQIANDFIRTILTPNCEIVINSLIYVIYSDFSIIIKNNNYNLLDSIHIRLDNISREEKLNIACETFHYNHDIHITTKEEIPNCAADFTFSKDNNNYLKYYFYNTSYGYDVANSTFLWTITGSNTSFISSNQNINFIFPNGGMMSINLKVYTNGSLCSQTTKYIDVGSCTANFYTTNSSNGKVYFNSISTANESFYKLTWNYGDGLASDIFVNNPPSQTTHTYVTNGTYTAQLSIETIGGCTSTYSNTVVVNNASDCCKSNDKEVEKNYQYNNGNNKLKFVFKVRNIFPFDYITAKTVNYKKTKRGNWLLQRADRLGADFYGNIYFYDCTNVLNLNLDNPRHEKNNSYSILKLDDLGSLSFRVRKNSIGSWFKINNGATNINGMTDLYLHNESCN